MKFKLPLNDTVPLMPVLRTSLIAALRDSDPHAYEFIVESYFDKAYRIAFAFTKDKAKASTVVSLAFQRLWDKRASIPDGASIIAHLTKYIRQIAK
jgi:DNA-directed RNA polymerase specialized sigma24 family protein